MSKPAGAGRAARAARPSLAFLADGGEVGALMRARDWSGSPLGPPAAWPQSLRSVVGLLLASRIPMFVAWGPELSLLYNEAYVEILGAKHPAALGARFRDAWGEIWPDISPLIDAALRGEATFRQDLPLQVNRQGFDEQAFFTFSYSPVRDKGGRVTGMFCACSETTGAVLARRREALLAQAGDALLRADGPQGAMAAAAELLGRHLGVGRAGYGEVDASGEVVSVARDWFDGGMASLAGEARILDAFGPAVIAELRAGRTLVVTDCRADPRTREPAFLATWDSIGTRALIVAPLLGAGRLAGILYAHSAEPRQWSAEEASLVEDMAARTLAHVERARAAEALRASEARFQAVANSVDQMIWSTRPDGFHDFYNQRWYDFTGMPEGSTDGEAWAGMFHPDDQERAWAAWRHSLETGEPYHIEYRLRHRSGQFRWVLGRAQAVRDGEGRIARWYGTCTDIQDIVDAREVLARSRGELERLVEERTAERDRMWDTSPDLMLAIDFEGVFRRVNPAWTAILGYAPEELVGRHVNEFVLAEDRTETTAAYEMAAEGGRPRIENRYRHKDGSTRWISWVAAPAGDVTYATGRDVTADKERQAELEAAQEQLRQAQKMEAVGQLTGGLAHDFNNLLAGISGSLELTASRMAQGRFAEVERYVAAAQGAAKRAAALTHRLLAFSRRQTLDPKPTDVNALVRGMEDLIRRTAGPFVSLEVVGASGLWPALVDASQLENALLNLCLNARDAMPDGGRITVETANRWLDARAAREHDMEPGQYLSLCVTDTGTGMTPEVKAKAFDPFFTTKPLGQGTGLGLSMIYGFARQSGGQVRIYSELGQGTTVCVYLPRHHDRARGEPPAAAGEPGADPAGPPRAPGDERAVLVVDDEPTVRMLLADILQELGCTAIEAADGEAGLRALRSEARIDLLVTDVGLPGGLNGRQLADAARELRPDLPVLLITGYAENAVMSAGSLGPGMEVLTKPFGVEAMSARIRELVGPA